MPAMFIEPLKARARYGQPQRVSEARGHKTLSSRGSGNGAKGESSLLKNIISARARPLGPSVRWLVVRISILMQGAAVSRSPAAELRPRGKRL